MRLILKICCLMWVLLLTGCFEGKQTVKIHSATNSEVLVDITIDKNAYDSLNKMQSMETMFDTSGQKSQEEPLPWFQKAQKDLLNIDGISQFQLNEKDINDGKSKRIQAQWHANSLEALTNSLKQLPAKDKLSIIEDKGIIHVNIGFANDKPMFLPMLKDKTYTLRLEGQLVDSNQPISLGGATELVIPLDVAENYLLTATIDSHGYSKKRLFLLACVLLVLGSVGFVLLRHKHKTLAIGIVAVAGGLVVGLLIFGLKRSHIDKVDAANHVTNKAVITDSVAPKIMTGEDEDMKKMAHTELNEADCQWLHVDVLPMCAQSQSMGSECDPSYVFEPNMIVTRGLNEMRQNPNFNEKAMVDACYQACQQQAVLNYTSFQNRVCGG